MLENMETTGQSSSTTDKRMSDERTPEREAVSQARENQILDRQKPQATRTGVPIDVLSYFGVYNTRDLSVSEENMLSDICRTMINHGLDTPEILLNIREMERTIQKPDFGQSRIMSLYNYFRISMEADKLEKQKLAFE